MKIAFSATNPCHMWPTAQAVHRAGALERFYSGYPAWKLGSRSDENLECHSLRTTIVYGLLKYAPTRLRPNPRTLYRWQDQAFDRSVGRNLKPADFVHAMPGQALETFRAARKLGVRTVLNHATGPVREWVRILRPEYERVGLKLEEASPYDASYFVREDEEYALADVHCAASTIVSQQLIQAGVPAERIWLVPYGADTGARVFSRSNEELPGAKFTVLFAGQLGLRKDLRTLLQALGIVGRADWDIRFVGAVLPETAPDFQAYRGAAALHFEGPVSQAELASWMRRSHVLVLPSLEEGFGLVIPQALNCGCPCIVSDRVGAKDYLRHRENGSIFPAQTPESLAEELRWWADHPKRVEEEFTWDAGVRTLLAESKAALHR